MVVLAGRDPSTPTRLMFRHSGSVIWQTAGTDSELLSVIDLAGFALSTPHGREKAVSQHLSLACDAGDPVAFLVFSCVSLCLVC